ncbi:shikimate dehydrogenase family protein [Echinicola vietnamensis]|uniref:Shikimate 5-dehydrogenase n=1 Tax=Echinicola vietnamensis (strain DSM 17526 / LMG 23754 / KMM 6221) TaxID=926556 RepID=L0FXD2_ECHVK|nr:shikimate dehydrogenase [Echinicola vietnamensis]AGA77416.1 shikimate 5-dehydrogenase [Echinicola vietnamensis DSM 17526]
MRKFGLIGYPLKHSFSGKYFAEKFDREGIQDCQYDLYEIDAISKFPELIKNNPGLEGINVTIPYKEQVIPYLDELEPGCEAIGAVNCIKIKENKLIGYNTDYIGFKESLDAWLEGQRPKALILGTGGASKAVKQALEALEMPYLMVSRNANGQKGRITYDDLIKNEQYLQEYFLIVNTTPLGTFPNTEEMPEIPVSQIGREHKVYDLVYNPEKTFLMRSLEARGAVVKNGLEMLQLQAEAAWKIWN